MRSMQRQLPPPIRRAPPLRCWSCRWAPASRWRWSSTDELSTRRDLGYRHRYSDGRPEGNTDAQERFQHTERYQRWRDGLDTTRKWQDRWQPRYLEHAVHGPDARGGNHRRGRPTHG